MDAVTEAIATVKKARHKEEAVRDVLPSVAPKLEFNATQRLFESPFMDVVPVMSKSARRAVLELALSTGGPLMSSFNEYVQFMALVRMIKEAPISTWARPANSYATEVANANSPMGAAYSILRKQKSLTPAATAAVLEAAFPLATNGLDEDTRNKLYELAAERGVSPVEIANVYGELIEVVTAVRFLEDASE